MKENFERELNSKKESEKKEFGNDVLLHVDFSRHGKKADFNAPRIKNFKEISKEAEAEDLTDYDVVAIRTTPVERSVHSALAKQEGLQQNKSYNKDTVNVRVRNLPTGVLSTEGVKIEKIMEKTDESKDVNLISPRIRELYKQAVQSTEGATWEKENAGVEVFIKLMKSNIESLKHVIYDFKNSDDLSSEAIQELKEFNKTHKEKNEMSMLEVTLRIMKHFKYYIKATNKFRSDSKIFISEINHSGFIEPFLIYLLNEQILENPIDGDGKSELEKIGGGFEPNESVGITIRRKKKDGDVEITFKLRNRIYNLNINDNASNIFIESERLLNLIKSNE